MFYGQIQAPCIIYLVFCESQYGIKDAEIGKRKLTSQCVRFGVSPATARL
jgi:hypothetical protein